ncbi:hypothetical protein GCM10023261_09570 [Bartonella jaculi]|uniref:Bartonella effector protein BID domain-containing protein n=1 Tax=Bartonella jaculi TaxID=686226 RepID=A0ABP9N4Q3_9HYPH
MVQSCKDEIKILSQAIYGDPDIFQNKLEEIEKNPVLGVSLSWQIAKNPALVASLAGKKVLGVKSKTRIEAEEKVSCLCLAIENYSESIKKAKENALHGHLAKQTLRRQSMDLRQMVEDLQKPRKPEQEAPLSHKELTRKVRSNTLVEYCHAEITYWCTIVYGDASVLQYRLEEIEKSPATGEELAWQVKTHPQLFGKLSGYNFHGLKSNARKQAENALTHLSDALEGYAEAIKHVQENIMQTHEEKQKRYTQSTELDKSMQRQQTVAAPPQLPEHSPENRHQESVETTMQTEWDRLGARPRTVTTPEKHRQEGVLPTSHTEQKTQGEQKAENQQKSRKPEKTMAPLSHKEMSDRVQNDHSVQRAQIEVYNWCKIVYNDPHTLQYNTEDIQKNPVLGEELSQQVANKPTMFAPLAGKQRFGVKNSARREAEASLPSLCAAIDRYTETVKEVRKDIVQTHQTQQNHQRQSSELTQDLQTQQVLSKTSQQHEHTTVTARNENEAAETSIQEQQELTDVRPRKVRAAKAMAFVS